jgi:uncharacterized protein YfaS (alpha-2-macroglobulin family)
MLSLLVNFDSHHKGIERLVFQLQDQLAERRWLSTQERNALFKAGTALLNNSNNHTWKVLKTSNTGIEKIIRSGDFNYQPVREELFHPVQLQLMSKQPLYTQMTISGYTRNAPEPEQQHFKISRSYFNTQGEQIVPEQIAVGELIIVELSLQSKKRIQDTLVVDLIPAGFELENQNLVHSLKLDHYTIGSEAIIDRISSASIKFQQWREDRYMAAIDLLGYGTQRLYYLLRAVTPGEYQVPPSYAEDMYRPYIRAIGETPEPVTVVNRF